MSNPSKNEMESSVDERNDANRKRPEFVPGSPSSMAWIRIAEGIEVLDARLEQEADEGRRRLLFDLLGQERCI